MKKYSLFILLTLLCIPWVIRAQMPFERHKAIRVTTYKKWVSKDQVDTDGLLNNTITIPNLYPDKKALTIQFTCFDTLDYSNIHLYRNKKLIQKLREDDAFYGLRTPYPVMVADYNGDGLKDLKFLVPNFACGAYNTYSRVIYLLQKPNGAFVKISFTDNFFERDQNRLERDFDGDGKFEVITQTFQSYGAHNYWLYNLYNFESYSLKNVNKKGDYPILIQLLYTENFTITNRVSRAQMKKLRRQFPDDYKRTEGQSQNP